MRIKKRFLIIYIYIIKNPNWPEADQRYTDFRPGVELETPKNKSSE